MKCVDHSHKTLFNLVLTNIQTIKFDSEPNNLDTHC